MNFHHLYRSVLFHLEHLTFPQFVLAAVVMLLLGVFCLRGFGSRSNY